MSQTITVDTVQEVVTVTANSTTEQVTITVTTPIGVIPSASPTVSGIAKLYADLSSNNTDGPADQNSVKVALAAKLAKNSAITGATKTKITYDTNGLVTTGADATTADIADSTDKRYCTDAQKTVIGNTSGTNTGDQDLSGYSLKLISANRNTSNYTLVIGDANKLVEMNLAGANTLTVPPNSSVAFSVGTQILLAQYGAGQTTVTAGAGVTIRSGGGAIKLAQQYAGATLIKIATDEWYLFGSIA